jgi:hypothetical protein
MLTYAMQVSVDGSEAEKLLLALEALRTYVENREKSPGKMHADISRFADVC